MKKVISLTLALLMLLSCFSVFSVGALDIDIGGIADSIFSESSAEASAAALLNLEIKNLPEHFECDIRDVKGWDETDKETYINLLGMDLDFLYNNEGPFNWGYLDVFTTDAAGNMVVKISYNDVSDAFSNLNGYLQRVIYNYCGGIDFYNVENAIAIINFIGSFLRPDFEKLKVDEYKNIFNNKVPSVNDFYKTISRLSGLSEILEYNWIPYDKSFYKPVIDVLGGNYVNFYEDYYADGVWLGAKIVEAVIGKVTTAGPIEFIVDILRAYSTSSYASVYRAPTLALLSHKKELHQTYIPASILNSFNGLLKMIFCNCDYESENGCFGDGSAVAHFLPLEFPVDRFAGATDNTEATLYLYYYLNLCGAYKHNRDVVISWKNAITNSSILEETDKERIKYVFDGFFLGGIKDMIDNTLVPLYEESNTASTDTLSQRFRNTMMNFLKKIADYFDYLRKIFSGELEYGQGNSPFN